MDSGRRLPRKILHIIDSEGFFGAEVMLLNLAGEQVRQGLEPTIASIGVPSIEEKDLERKVRDRGLNIRKIRMRAGPNFSGAFKLLKWAVRENFELLHSHGYKGNILFGLMPKKWRRLPLVSTLHGYTSTNTFSKIRLYEWLDERSLKFIDAVVLVSEGMARHSRLERARGIDFQVVPNGIPRIEEVDWKILSDSRVAFGGVDINDFCRNGFTIGSIGRLSAEKGYQHLIEALHLLVRKGIDARLVIIGEGCERPQLEGLASRLKLSERVSLPGYRDQAWQYLRYFNAFAISSLTEGLPITLLEAMQARVPIVATRVGGIPEALIHGKSGLLVDPGRSQPLAEALLVLYKNKDLARRLAEIAGREVDSRFSARTMAQGYLRVYEQVFERSRSKGNPKMEASRL